MVIGASLIFARQYMYNKPLVWQIPVWQKVSPFLTIDVVVQDFWAQEYWLAQAKFLSSSQSEPTV